MTTKPKNTVAMAGEKKIGNAHNPTTSGSCSIGNSSSSTIPSESIMLSINIIGDAFADIFCYLEEEEENNNNNNNNNNVVVEPGGDARLRAPVRTVPGGSALNTTTHLHQLLTDFVGDKSGIEKEKERRCSSDGEEQQEEKEKHDNGRGCSTPNQVDSEKNGVDSEQHAIPTLTTENSVDCDCDCDGTTDDENDVATKPDCRDQQQQQKRQQQSVVIDVSLQTVLNENDEYGQLLLNHANKCGFRLINCRNNHRRNPSKRTHENNSDSTGHCIVIVSNGERSFLTHLGCVGDFTASDIDMGYILRTGGGDRNDGTIRYDLTAAEDEKERVSPSESSRRGQLRGRGVSQTPSSPAPPPPSCLCDTNTAPPAAVIRRHYNHVHVAGYYNIPGFWNGSLRDQLAAIRRRQQQQAQQQRQCHTTATTISLVPQYDASNQWDGRLLDALSYVDFLIASESEVYNIHHSSSFYKNDCTKRHYGKEDDDDNSSSSNNNNNNNNNDDDDDEDDDDDVVMERIQQVSQFFHETCPNLYVIMTRGKKGAMVLFHGRILCTQRPSITLHYPLDPTGAGDAFAAGFLHGFFGNLIRASEEQRYRSTKTAGAAAADGGGDDGGDMSHNGRRGCDDNDIDSNQHRLWQSAIRDGLQWGCAVGTCCVMKEGAAVPSTKEDIMSLMEKSK